jgi:AraC-like DNA-binding protein
MIITSWRVNIKAPPARNETYDPGVAVEWEPAPALRPYVRRYYGFRETTDSPMRRLEGPGVDVIILLSFDFDWRIGAATNPSGPWERHTSFVAGLHEGSVLTEHDGRSYGMQVSLTPPGAYALFGLPMHELAGLTISLDAVGTQSDRLPEQLAELEGWTERFELLDSTIASRLENAQPASPGVIWAWRRLTQTDGQVPIGELVRELGWSRKRLAAGFREEVGLSPKSLARLLRFERAKALLERDDRPFLTHLALECGYYDQSHLSNEFRRITGTTPAAYAASRSDETNLQDAVPARS